MQLLFNNKEYPVNSAMCYINFDDMESSAYLTININANNSNDIIELGQALKLRIDVIPPSGEESSTNEIILNPEAAESMPIYLKKQNNSTINLSNYIPQNINLTFDNNENEEITIVFKRSYEEEII